MGSELPAQTSYTPQTTTGRGGGNEVIREEKNPVPTKKGEKTSRTATSTTRLGLTPPLTRYRKSRRRTPGTRRGKKKASPGSYGADSPDEKKKPSAPTERRGDTPKAEKEEGRQLPYLYRKLPSQKGGETATKKKKTTAPSH